MGHGAARGGTGGHAVVAGLDEQDSRQSALDDAVARRRRHARAHRPPDTFVVVAGVDAATVDVSGQCHIPPEHRPSLATLLNVSVSQLYGQPPDSSGDGC